MKKMKYLLFLIAMIAALYNSNNVAAQQGHFQKTPVVADGCLDDWQMPLRFADKRYTVSYNITNDSNFLYFVANSRDWRMMKRILKEGITLYFDPKGKESEKRMSINFPEQKTDIDGLLKDADSVALLNTLVLQSDVYDAENFLNIENGQYGVADRSTKIRIGLRATIDSGLVYEVILPITSVLNDGLTPKSLKKRMSVGVLIHVDDSRKTQTANGVKNNNNTASAFQNDNGFGSRGGAAGLGGSRMNRNSSFGAVNLARHDIEEELWCTFSPVNGN